MEVKPMTIWGGSQGGLAPEGGRLDATFLQLLVAEMRYQDPFSPVSSKEVVSQLFLLTSLERMKKMEEKLDQLSKIQAALLVGMRVGFLDPTSGERAEGVVERVVFGDEVKLVVDGKEVGLGNIEWATSGGRWRRP